MQAVGQRVTRLRRWTHFGRLDMTPKTLAALAALPLLAAQGDIAVARAPAPLLPTALVEDVHSASAEVEFMDYVGRGQVIRLPKDLTERTLTLRRTDRPGERRTLKLDDAAARSEERRVGKGCRCRRTADWST